LVYWTGTHIGKDINSATSQSISSIIQNPTRASMVASHTKSVEERPEDQLAGGHPLTGEPVFNSEEHPQIEMDPPSGPALVSRESTAMNKDYLTVINSPRILRDVP
jgi:hypothetical protein